MERTRPIESKTKGISPRLQGSEDNVLSDEEDISNVRINKFFL
jgi:hypothetical protein